MKILLSPAKTMKECKLGMNEPTFTKRTQILLKNLKKLNQNELSSLMNISEKISELNYDRFQKFSSQKKGAALFYFQGDVYKGLDANSFSKSDINYAQNTIRILSGLYGILKPLDNIQPYRLEMGTNFSVNNNKNLYEFWNKTLTDHFKSELKKEELVVNLASVEYSKAVSLASLNNIVIEPVFKDYKNGKYKIISIYAKMARGLMAQYIIKNKVKTLEQLNAFNLEGYIYNKKLSTATKPVFTRD